MGLNNLHTGGRAKFNKQLCQNSLRLETAPLTILAIKRRFLFKIARPPFYGT